MVGLPVYYLIKNLCLFGTGSPQVDSGGFNAVMTKQIGEKSDIPSVFNEIFRKTVAEGVGVYRPGIQVIAASVSL